MRNIIGPGIKYDAFHIFLRSFLNSGSGRARSQNDREMNTKTKAKNVLGFIQIQRKGILLASSKARNKKFVGIVRV